MFALFQYFNDKRPLPDGEHIIGSPDCFLDMLYVNVENGAFFDQKNNKELSKDEISYYSHYFPQINIPKDVDDDPMDWYIEYERYVEVKTREDNEKGIVYSLKDCKDHEFEIYFDDFNDMHLSIVNNKMIYIPENIIGWQDVSIPEGLTFNTSSVFNKNMQQMIFSVLQSFKQHYGLSEIQSEKTERGFSYLDFNDVNENEFSFQESSVATESRIWFGRNDYTVTYQKQDFSGKQVEKLLREGKFEPINSINHKFGMSILLSTSIEISIYHADAICDIILKHQ